MKSVKTDYHIHPDYSPDASPASIRDYCCRAVELGLAEICFTTHVELDPVRREVDNFVIVNGRRVSVFNPRWLDNYFTEISRAQREFKGAGLNVKAGVEVGYCPGTEKDIENITANHPFDYVLGAVHCINHVAISSRQESPHYFRHNSITELGRDYFGTLKEAVNTGLFDCIAHLDLYRRYGTKYYGSDVFTVHRGFIEPIFKEMARRGMGLEINTSSRRRGLKEFHPCREIVALAAEAGIEIFTVGSDAHAPEQLGEHIGQALSLLAEFDLCNHVYTQRRAVPLFNGADGGHKVRDLHQAADAPQAEHRLYMGDYR
ncbi:MAG: histidinol-phosphatase [Firmicutes bacterium]|nr:histidinol-phosphatase [Bacillota bacterium]